VAALNFNIFARHADRVRMANIAQMVNVIHSLILTDGAKMLKTPTWHVYKMFVPFQDAQLLPLTLPAATYVVGKIALPQVDGIAARGKDGAVWLALTNLDADKAVEFEVKLAGVVAKSARGEVLTAEKVDAVNSFDRPDAVAAVPVTFAAKAGKLVVKLPAKSVTVVRLGA
jgi:alpha-L-arabinofuranosidase